MESQFLFELCHFSHVFLSFIIPLPTFSFSEKPFYVGPSRAIAFWQVKDLMKEEAGRPSAAECCESFRSGPQEF